MFKEISKSLLCIVAVTSLGACSTSFNGPEDALTVEQEHPIAVDSQVVTMTVNVESAESELSSLDKARLRGFADSYMRAGHGPITVTAPSGAARDRDGEQTAADIRGYLNEIGVPWSSMTGASYRTGAESNTQLILSYTHYVATPSPCGIWTDVNKRESKNLRSANFGCATQNNIAAMLSDPRDLIAPADSSAPDAEARIRGVRAFREGDVTASQTDSEIEQQIAN